MRNYSLIDLSSPCYSLILFEIYECHLVYATYTLATSFNYHFLIAPSEPGLEEMATITIFWS